MARGFTVLDVQGRIKTVSASVAQTVVTTTATGTQNNFAPGLIGDTLVRCNNPGDMTITGLSGGVDGQRVTFVALNTGNVFLSHQAAGSSAANRFTNFVTTGDTPLAASSGGSATYMYDGTSATWRLIAHDQGARITWSPTYSASGSMTYSTVTTTAAKYYLKGRIALITYDFSGTVGGTPSTQIFMALPNSWQGSYGAFNAYNENTTGIISVMQSRASSNNLEFYSTATAAANWVAGTRHIVGTVAMEIL